MKRYIVFVFFLLTLGWNGNSALADTPSIVETAYYNGHTYYLLEVSTWEEAEAAAMELGGHLVTINDANENDFIENQFYVPYERWIWIGLNDVNETGNWVWTNGEPLTYTNWGSGEPNNFGSEHYVHMWGNGEWNNMNGDTNSDRDMQGVVEISDSEDEDEKTELRQKVDSLFDQLEYLYGELFYPLAITQEMESIFVEPYTGTMYFRGYDRINIAIVQETLFYEIDDQWYIFSTLDEANDFFCNGTCFDEKPLTPISPYTGQWSSENNDDVDISFEVFEDGTIINFRAEMPVGGGHAVTRTASGISVDPNDLSFTVDYDINGLTSGTRASITCTFLSPNQVEVTYSASYIIIPDTVYRGNGEGFLSKTSSLNTPPSAPTDVSATDGTYSEKVEITWTASIGTTSYEIWRNTSSSTSSATKVGTATETYYDDYDGETEQIYYYWVKAKNNGGTGDFSVGDTGYKIDPPSAPTGVSASNGTSTLSIDITWNASDRATSYEVWQSKTNDAASAKKITSTSKTSYEHMNSFDFTGGTIYYYWVKAKNSAGISDFSKVDIGWVKKLW